MTLSATSVLPRNIRAAVRRESGIQVSAKLIRSASCSAELVLRECDTRGGLS
jgi:hypothetical protein